MQRQTGKKRGDARASNDTPDRHGVSVVHRQETQSRMRVEKFMLPF